MDEENKQDSQKDSEQSGSQPHVRIFGAEVSTDGKAETKEEWRKRKEEWKQQHRIQRDQWRQQRQQSDHHGGGVFWGFALLIVGVLALLYTMGYVSPVFWQAVIPFWPILLILWGAGIILGRHWFARLILFIFTLVFIIIIILYGLVRTGSPLVSSLSPNVVRAVQTAQPQQY